MDLHKLTKAELIHICQDMVGEVAVERAIKATFKYQSEFVAKYGGCKPCNACEAIARKLGLRKGGK